MRTQRALVASMFISVAFNATACSAADQHSATLEHNLGGRHTLSSYPPVPAQEKRQVDKVSERMYGFETLSPKTPYFCTWRDRPRPVTERGGRPLQVFLTCSFGSGPWTPPATLIAESQERQRREEAHVQILWERKGNKLEMLRFQLQITSDQGTKQFRSKNYANDLLDVKFKQITVKFPDSETEDVKFSLSAIVPYRLNRGEDAGADTVDLKIQGSAVPMPRWLLY